MWVYKLVAKIYIKLNDAVKYFCIITISIIHIILISFRKPVFTLYYCVDSETRYSDFVLNTVIMRHACKCGRIKMGNV